MKQYYCKDVCPTLLKCDLCKDINNQSANLIVAEMNFNNGGGIGEKMNNEMKETHCFNDQGGGVMLEQVDGISPTIRRETKHHEPLVYTIDANDSNSMKSSNPNSGIHEASVAKTLDTTVPTPQKAQGWQMVCYVANGFGCKEEGNVASTLSKDHDDRVTGNNSALVTHTGYVRRLTPRECERLMGFPDDYTKIAWRGKSAEDCPDSPRYAACGNSMCVNVMRWIGMRIEQYDKKHKETEK